MASTTAAMPPKSFPCTCGETWQSPEGLRRCQSRHAMVRKSRAVFEERGYDPPWRGVLSEPRPSVQVQQRAEQLRLRCRECRRLAGGQQATLTRPLSDAELLTAHGTGAAPHEVA